MVELNWWIIGAVMSRAAIVTAVQTAGIIVLGQRVFAGNGTLSAGTPHFLGQVSLLVLAFALLMAADVAFGFRPARGFTIRAIEPPPLLDTERFASWNEADYFSQMLYNHGAVSKRMEDSLRYAVILSGVALIVLGVALALR